MAGLPYQPMMEALGAREVLEIMERVDRKVARKLNELHAKRAEQVNKRRREPPNLLEGTKVWYKLERRPETDKLAPLWKGPGIVLERIGEHSYVVELGPGVRQEAHRSQLKPYREDYANEDPFPLFYFSSKAEEVEVGPDEYIV